MKKIFSGIQPSGTIHLGNYLGAISQWVSLQESSDEAIFCIVDLHAITVSQDPAELRENIAKVAVLYLAAGINPEKSIIFVQSTRSEHAELAWILNTIAKMGELSRMTQFKDKSSKEKIESVNLGLFGYPVLMAADILLYQTTQVPVGEDQKQHVELARDLATRFNSKFGITFSIPEPIIKKESARIMGLDDPTKKMSKSANSVYNYISILDKEDVAVDKIKRAVTDSGSEIRSSADKPAITNLLNIYSQISGKSVSELETEFQGKNYGSFKESLAVAVVDFLKPIQKKYENIISDRDSLAKILESGSERAGQIGQKTLHDVKNKLGLGI